MMYVALVIVAGIVAGADQEVGLVSEAEADALLNSAECVGAIDPDRDCLDAAFIQEAEGFTSGRLQTLAEDVAKAAGKKPPEYESLTGIALPTRATIDEECTPRIEHMSKCVGALVLVDLWRWTRGVSSRFGDALAAELVRFRNYRGGTGFQQTRWGMTPAEVLRIFPKLVQQSNATFTTKMPVAGYPGKVSFLFVDGRLWSVEVDFDVYPTRPDQDVRRTLDLRRLLTEKYGEPKVTDGSASGGDVVAFDALLRDFGGVGRAIRRGSMIMRAGWSPNEMEIELMLGAAVGDYTHRLVYRSDVFVQRAMRARDARRASEL